MRRFEYLELEDDSSPHLDQLGLEGWELVSVVSMQISWYDSDSSRDRSYPGFKYIFKRELYE